MRIIKNLEPSIWFHAVVNHLAEPPERKALKNLLVKLKAKSIESENRYVKNTMELNSLFTQMFGTVKERLNQNPEDERAKTTDDFLHFLYSTVGVHIRETISTIEDFKLYIESLEEAYKQLDDTFERAVYEPARKQAEAKIKEQEELAKKGSTGYIK